MAKKQLCAAAALLITVSASGEEASPAGLPEGTGDALRQVLQTESGDEAMEPLSGFKDAFVTLAVTPKYPRRALKKKIDGEITLTFDISKHGRAENITVVSEEPSKIFRKEAVDALQYWAFSPARLATCGTLVQKASQTLRFDHDGDPQIQFAPLMINDIPQPHILPRFSSHSAPRSSQWTW